MVIHHPSNLARESLTEFGSGVRIAVGFEVRVVEFAFFYIPSNFGVLAISGYRYAIIRHSRLRFLLRFCRGVDIAIVVVMDINVLLGEHHSCNVHTGTHDLPARPSRAACLLHSQLSFKALHSVVQCVRQCIQLHIRAQKKCPLIWSSVFLGV